MIVEFDKSFERSLNKVKDKTIFPKIEKLLLLLEKRVLWKKSLMPKS